MNLLKVGPIEKLTRKDAEAPEYTRHVWYDVENGRLVATNDHALVIAAVEPETGDVSGFVATDAIGYARALARLTKCGSLRCERERFVFKNGGTSPRPQGEYPDYASIVPKISGPPTLTFNPELLAQIVAAFPKQEIGKKGTNPGSISLWNGTAEEKLKAALSDLIEDARLIKQCTEFDGCDICKAEELLSLESDKPSPIVVKAHYDGGLAVLMPVSGMDPTRWNTDLPKGR
jgi:hypothetical protein